MLPSPSASQRSRNSVRACGGARPPPPLLAEAGPGRPFSRWPRWRGLSRPLLLVSRAVARRVRGARFPWRCASLPLCVEGFGPCPRPRRQARASPRRSRRRGCASWSVRPGVSLPGAGPSRGGGGELGTGSDGVVFPVLPRRPARPTLPFPGGGGLWWRVSLAPCTVSIGTPALPDARKGACVLSFWVWGRLALVAGVCPRVRVACATRSGVTLALGKGLGVSPARLSRSARALRVPARPCRLVPPSPHSQDLLASFPGRASLASRSYLVDPASSICLSQRLSHACLSTHGWYSETANGSLNQLWFLWSLAPLLLG